MKKSEESEIGNALKNLPGNLATLIKESLDSKNPGKKLEARSSLVNMGKNIVPQMHKLVVSKSDLLRMETAKIIELISDRRSIPFFINLLDDKEFEIRWIAADGLINIGRRSILPLLISIRDGKSSLFFNKGAHHVLLGLLNEKERGKVNSLLLSLDNSKQLGEIAPVEASNAIKLIFKRTNRA